jgi:hypothetical protein
LPVASSCQDRQRGARQQRRSAFVFVLVSQMLPGFPGVPPRMRIPGMIGDRVARGWALRRAAWRAWGPLDGGRAGGLLTRLERGGSVVLTVAEALAWYLIHPYDERNLYLYLYHAPACEKLRGEQ